MSYVSHLQLYDISMGIWTFIQTLSDISTKHRRELNPVQNNFCYLSIIERGMKSDNQFIAIIGYLFLSYYYVKKQ